MAIKKISGKVNSWVFIDQVGEDAGDYLKENFKFHPLDLEDVLSARQRPKIDVYRYYIFLICVFPYYDAQEKNKIRGREVDIFLTKDCLVTVSKKPFPVLREIFDKMDKGDKLKKIWLGKSPSFLLYKILEILLRSSNSSLDYWSQKLAEVEDDVYDHELKSVAHDLANIRRGVLALRRILEPQKMTINTLVGTRKDFIPVEMVDYFDNIDDYVEKMCVTVENFKDSVDGLHLTNESLISQRTNRTIKILTVISVALMPLTLLSGIYGMNLSRLPYAEQPEMVFGFFGIAILFIITLIFVIYKKGRF
ncbi:MAG: magnesium transporter CorA family protein [Patescibacteria group bacterium]|jgi:magnesium transporter